MTAFRTPTTMVGAAWWDHQFDPANGTVRMGRRTHPERPKHGAGRGGRRIQQPKRRHGRGHARPGSAAHIVGAVLGATISAGCGPVSAEVEISTPHAATVTTSAGVESHRLVVGDPAVGQVVEEQFVLLGESTAEMVGYELYGGGDTLLTDGAVAVVGGSFGTTIAYTNTCCTELTLRVFDYDAPQADRIIVEVPLVFVEYG